MAGFGIRYVNGIVLAAEPESHDRVEWPPYVYREPQRSRPMKTIGLFDRWVSLEELLWTPDPPLAVPVRGSGTRYPTRACLR